MYYPRPGSGHGLNSILSSDSHLTEEIKFTDGFRDRARLPDRHERRRGPPDGGEHGISRILMGYVSDAIDNMSKSLAMRMRTATATKLNVKQGMGHGERFRVDSHRKEGHGVQEHRHGDDKQGHDNHEWCSKNF